MDFEMKTLETPGKYVDLTNMTYEDCYYTSFHDQKVDNHVEEFRLLLKDIPDNHLLREFILALQNEEI